MKVACLVVCALALGCGSDGNGGDGDDSLPKRGERDTDPTIVSATMDCIIDGTGTALTVAEIRVAASDPMGMANLGTATVTLEGMTDVDSGFSSGSANTSYHEFTFNCARGTTYTVDIIVSNNTGGVTTASTKIRSN